MLGAFTNHPSIKQLAGNPRAAVLVYNEMKTVATPLSSRDAEDISAHFLLQAGMITYSVWRQFKTRNGLSSLSASDFVKCSKAAPRVSLSAKAQASVALETRDKSVTTYGLLTDTATFEDRATAQPRDTERENYDQAGKYPHWSQGKPRCTMSPAVGATVLCGFGMGDAPLASASWSGLENIAGRKLRRNLRRASF